MPPFDVGAWLAAWRPGEVTAMTRPRQCGCWSKLSRLQGGDILFGDDTGLLDYRQPQLPADLNEGFPGAYTPKDEGAESPCDPIVAAALHAGEDLAQVGVVSFRNNLNKVLLTPQQPGEAWAMDALLLGRTLFLDIHKTPQASYPNQERFVYYGYKFEALCTGEAQVDATSEFGIAVRYRLGQLELLMGAEVDCAAQQGEGPTGGRPYVELKTFAAPRHAKAVASLYGQKHPRWWVQSHLAGISTLVLGGRDVKGTLIKVHEVPVRALPGLSREAGHAWDPERLLAFGEAVLLWLRDQARAQPGVQLLASYDPAARVIACVPVQGGGMAARLAPLLAERQQQQQQQHE